jgi:hypothetical protein
MCAVCPLSGAKRTSAGDCQHRQQISRRSRYQGGHPKNFKPRPSLGFFPSCGSLCGIIAGNVPRSLPRYHGGRGVRERRRRVPKTPTLLDVLGVRGKLNLQNHERSLPRAPDSNLGVKASPTRIVGGDIMSTRIIEEGSVEAIARLQKQDEEFCRRLRAAIETGRECCPTTVFTEPARTGLSSRPHRASTPS